MSSSSPRRARMRTALIAAGLALSPALALGCACGCGIFDVGGTTGLMPDLANGNFSIFFRYDYMNQDRNQQGARPAPAAQNADKGINTSFYTPGGLWQINQNWSVEGELPLYARHLRTTDDGTVDGPAGSIYTGKILALGDMQITGIYTGLQPNLQTGLIFGLKLPTGDISGPTGRLGGHELDRDTLPGTGSTDIILGVVHNGTLTDDGRFGYYVQQRAQFPVATQGGYRPGSEFDSAAGVDYTCDLRGFLSRVTPVFSIENSYRLHDGGPHSNAANSGYERVFLAPGVELRFANLRLYADVELPVYQFANAASFAATGNSGQLVAPVLYKVQVNYDF